MSKDKTWQLSRRRRFRYLWFYAVLSSADGLSFNYEDKSLEEDVFTARHEYKCKQDLGQEMRDRLKLNFNVLYEDIDPYEDYEDD